MFRGQDAFCLFQRICLSIVHIFFVKIWTSLFRLMIVLLLSSSSFLALLKSLTLPVTMPTWRFSTDFGWLLSSLDSNLIFMLFVWSNGSSSSLSLSIAIANWPDFQLVELSRRHFVHAILGMGRWSYFFYNLSLWFGRLGRGRWSYFLVEFSLQFGTLRWRDFIHDSSLRFVCLIRQRRQLWEV